MTSSHIAYLVILKEPIREDDAECGILTALRMIKGVVSVEPVINDLEKQLAKQQARRELISKLFEALQN